MNSVFSAFKTNKNDKQKSLIGGKRIVNPQDSSYENLRHIREIASSTKMMTSIVNDDVEEDLLNLGKRQIIKTTMLTESDCFQTIDVVDHAPDAPAPVVCAPTLLPPNDISRLQQQQNQPKIDIIKPPEQFSTNSNSSCNNNIINCMNSSSSSSSNNSQQTCDTLQSPTPINDVAIINFNSIESNILPPPPPSSPTISRCSSSCSNSSSTSCEVTTIAATLTTAPPSSAGTASSPSPSPLPSSSASATAAASSSLSTSSSSSSTTSSASSSSSSSTSSSSTITTNNFQPIFSDNHTQPIIMGNSRASNCSCDGSNSNSGSKQHMAATTSSSASTTPKSARYNKPRLSLSGFTNSSMPSVHGRPSTTPASNGGQPKTRLSTHQRNLSLDFRSMGILLPPVSQVTNTRINLTQHHRNRSLDSALQRIPEVEVSSPNAETENTFCTNSILGSTMCSKIVISSSTNPQNTPKAGNGSTNSIEPCTRPNSTANIMTDNSGATAKVSESKKREDLTSLGSDDSGIICGSESDQVSLNRIRQSHESLDSGEIDQEEECIEILETTSMDEEYRMLQSDLCFYQTPEKDMRALNNHRKADDQLDVEDDCNNDSADDSIQDNSGNPPTIVIDNNRICVPIDIDDETATITNGSTTNSESADITPTTTDDVSKLSEPALKQDSKPEHIKNEILFKNFFGATKNAIFRTAQSIIENHEKKNSAKNKIEESDVKSPTEISKKKEFFILKSSSSKNKVGTVTTPDPVPETETKTLTKTASGTSLNKLRVPGVVKCFVREKDQSSQHMRVEKGPSGLLRFFESPVFNIHFAVHYLFYSKEPGVLSFIGNKVFSFPDQEVDLYIPQLIVMYIQMDELAEVLDPYLTFRSRKSVDFSLKCLWLLEAYNYQIDTLSMTSSNGKKTHLSLMRELYPKKEKKQLKTHESEILSPIKKTHHRSQSDATGLLNDSRRFSSSGSLTLNAKIYPPTPAKLCLGDLTSGKAFDNGCICFESVRGTVNDLLGHKTVCCCGAPKMAPQKEFMRALINIGKNLTTLQTKTEKTSTLRVFLNLINKNLPARVWLPLHSDIPHHIVRITEEKTAVLNSKDKTPYIIYVEVVEVNDIYSSPVIIKMMPTLRHTKSEEHLDSKEKNNSTSNSSSNLSAKETRGTNDCKDAKVSESSSISENGRNDSNELHFTEDDVWSQEDDEITAQYLNLRKVFERDAISQMSLDSCDSRDPNVPTLFNIGDVRTRHANNLNCENTKPFSNDPEDPSAAALKEPWHEKEKLIRESSPYGHLSNWRLLSAIVKCGDDLRQELMATQLLEMFKIIWIEENVDLWVRPYKIVCLSNDSGLIEPILNTVSLHQIKKNSNKSLRDYFIDEYGDPEALKFKTAQRNFMQSCAAYCLISYLLQVKDRHNGNILLHSDGHLIHIDFGFILSISPKNLGFEQSPFKLTPEFVDVMGGTSSELWTEFNHLLLKGLMAARKHMDRIINLVEIMRSNAQLPCFKNGCSGTVQNLRKRFHMNLTEQELERKVEQLVQDSLKSLSTKLYDGYQYFTNGIL